MKASVRIDKSFDETRTFRKEWQSGDFREFLETEGGYVDGLCKIAEDKGKEGQGFTITYTITVTK